MRYATSRECFAIKLELASQVYLGPSIVSLNILLSSRLLLTVCFPYLVIRITRAGDYSSFVRRS